MSQRPLGIRGILRPLALLGRQPGPLALVLTLMALAGLAEGFGVLLLIPLLGLVGIDVPLEGAMGTVASSFETALNALGMPVILPVVLAAYVLVVAVQSGLRYLERVQSAALVEDFKARLRERVFRAVARADWPFHLRSRGSDILHVLTDEVSRVGFSLDQSLGVVTAAVTALAYLAVAFYLSPLATGVALATALVLLLVLRARAARSWTAGEDFSEASGSMYFAATEFLAGIKTAKSHATEDRHTRAFGQVTHELARSWVQAARSYADVQLFFTTGAVVVLSLLVWAALEVIRLDAAALLVLVFIFLRLIPRFSGLQNSVQHLANALPAHDRVDRLIREAEEAAEWEGAEGEAADPAPAPGGGRGAPGEDAAGPPGAGPRAGAGAPPPDPLREGIRMEGVSFAYPEAEQGPVVRSVTLEIPANGTTALVGPSGGGKTTLADLLIGLLQPQEGEILVDGSPLASLDLRGWRRGMGYVAQESFLFNDTIRANLTMGEGGHEPGSGSARNGEGEPAETGDDDLHLFAALAAAGLEGFVRGLPRGLDTVVGERGVRLSGGERQRLALARALIRRPRLLILDEATSALDYESEALIREALGRLKGEMTVVMITHRLYLARDADRVHVMEEGRLVESGTWDELMAGGGRFAALSASSGAGA